MKRLAALVFEIATARAAVVTSMQKIASVMTEQAVAVQEDRMEWLAEHEHDARVALMLLPNQKRRLLALLAEEAALMGGVIDHALAASNDHTMEPDEQEGLA